MRRSSLLTLFLAAAAAAVLLAGAGPASANLPDCVSGGGRIVVAANQNLTFSNCQVSGNPLFNGDGGGVLNHGELRLTNVTVTGNHATGSGGGIYNDGVLRLDHVTIDHNQADADGGGLATRDLGGSHGIIDGHDVVIDHNTALGDAGGLWGHASYVLQRSAITNNTAGGNGGGVWGVLGLETGTISGNHAGLDGGGSFTSTGVLRDVTVSDNTAAAKGGALAMEAIPNVTGNYVFEHVTFAYNGAATGGGIYYGSPSQFGIVLFDSIIADSSSGGDCSTPLGPVSWNMHNLDSDSTCGLTGSDSLSGVDPQLGPLQYNAPGPTYIQTRALPYGSPAIGTTGATNCYPPTDARGAGWVTCDYGAYAFQPDVSLTTTKTDLGGGAYDVTVTLANNAPNTLTGGSLQFVLNGSTASTVDPLVVPTPDLPTGGSFTTTWHVTGAAGCDPANSFDVIATYSGADGTAPKLGHGDLPGPGCASKSGTVTADFGKTPLGGAQVILCELPAGTPCAWAQTDAGGRYSIGGLPAGDYSVGVFPGLSAQAAGLVPLLIGSEHISAGQAITAEDFDLQPLHPLPNGSFVGGAGFQGDDGGVVRLHRGGNIQITRRACNGGIAKLELDENGLAFYGPVTMPELPPGTYTVIVPAQSQHSWFQVKIVVDCPTGPDDVSTFDAAYSDPSGTIRNGLGAPEPGARVTLLRSDSPTGPFAAVPDGSRIMSLTNRTNPDVSDARGQYGWLVLAGYYKVRAEKPGCTSAESAVQHIPPPVTGLDLTLRCPSELEQTVAGMTIPDASLAADLAHRAHAAAVRLAQSRPQGCDALDAFVTQVVFEAGQDAPGLTIAQAKTLATEAYRIETTNTCPNRGAAEAEQADLDVFATINSLPIDATLAGDLRATARQISTALTGGRTTDACAKVGSFVAKVKAQTGKKLTPGQATALTNAAGAIGC